MIDLVLANDGVSLPGILDLLALKLRRRADALRDAGRYAPTPLQRAREEGAELALREFAGTIDALVLILGGPLTPTLQVVARSDDGSAPIPDDTTLTDDEHADQDEPEPLFDPWQMVAGGVAFWGEICFRGHEQKPGRAARYAGNNHCVECTLTRNEREVA